LRSFSFDGERYDTGNPAGWVQANIALALKEPRFQESTKTFLKLISGTY
jgi:UTP-glucose-1-phosphate uridylyltransferase